jgi:teichuronic acid biosynthesis glycosyltransferase TuaC
MKVLFVSSGNSKTGISPIVQRQGLSLTGNGIDIHFFTIRGKELKGYLGNLKQLRAVIRQVQPDIVHAHYSMSAYLATLAGASPLVVSLMGSEVTSAKGAIWLLQLMSRLRWRHVIVKTEEMSNRLGMAGCSIIPNGVDTAIFSPMEKARCREQLNWSANGKHILFAANPSRHEKNYILAMQAVELVQEAKIEIHVLKDVPPAEIPLWMNAADVILLTSLREGSPNVVKEAMACNRPVVATDVGDISWLFGKELGHFLTGLNVEDVAEKIKVALEYSLTIGSTDGRSRIIDLGLDAPSVAQKIMGIYEEILKKNG